MQYLMMPIVSLIVALSLYLGARYAIPADIHPRATNCGIVPLSPAGARRKQYMLIPVLVLLTVTVTLPLFN
jgi:hypothetical protein